MLVDSFEIKSGIKAHLIQNDIFKTNIACVLLTTPLKRETVTQNALLPFLLRSGTKNLKTQLEINKKLEEMYGASFDCGIDKMGDNQVLKFYIESINDNFVGEKDEMLKQTTNFILEIVFNTLIENGQFNEDILNIEKQNLRQVIESKIDDKDIYAFENCINSMYGDKGFGLYKYGFTEDISKISAKSLADSYIELINNCKIDIFISGDLKNIDIKGILENNENIKKLIARKPNYILNNESTESKQKVENIQEKREILDVAQGKLVIGLDILSKQKDIGIVALVYNAILGDGVNSMLFQNVREKASLAYSTKSKYVKQKANIFIRCGIEVDNYQKALDIIKEQLDNIKNGNFTEEDISNAKCYLISGIKAIEEEQDSEIVFYIGNEISNINMTLKQYIDVIQNITKEEIIEFANLLEYNTIYFLSNK
ncbi:MAG: insulinase family protein [Clostridia bacterium]|nr:insulinase family protein [Clostridia bacterium]